MQDMGKKLLKWIPVILIGVFVLGFITEAVLFGLSNYFATGTLSFTGADFREIFSPNTLVFGAAEVAIILVAVVVNGNWQQRLLRLHRLLRLLLQQWKARSPAVLIPSV